MDAIETMAAVFTGLDERVQEAHQEYVLRRDMKKDPVGAWDKGGRWYPMDSERCKCCDDIRKPSRNYPYSLLNHCRSAGHVANLYGVERRQVLSGRI